MSVKAVLLATIAASAFLALGAMRLRDRECRVPAQLQVRNVIPVPDSLSVTGVALHRSGATLLWTEDKKLYLIASGDTRARLIDDDADVVAAAFSENESTFVVLTRQPATVTHMHVRAGVTATTPVAIHGHIAEAVMHDGRWFAAEEFTDGRWRLLSFQEHGSVAPIVTFDPVPRAAPTQWFRLGASSEAVFITRTEWPFDVTRVSTEGRQSTTRLNGVDTTLLRGAFVSLPTLPLACGTLQTLADRQSHRRVLVLRDKAGRVARVRDMDVPMGFTASVNDDSMLVGMRSLGSREVVSYSWR